MKIHNVEQGSVDWYQLRLGIPTASSFHKIVTPLGKLSEQATKYMDYLIAETLLNRPLETMDGLEWMERGKELEPQAVQMYQFENEVETKEVGFITTDDGLLGCSPDRILIGKNGAVELKCPSPQVHVGYMRKTFDKNYVPQVQGQMLVGEFDYVDRYSYHPELPPHTDKTYRDEKYIRNLRDALDEFNTKRLEALVLIQAQGFFEERKKLLTPTEAAYAEPAGEVPGANIFAG